jgi:predicted transcriptional regulator
MTRGEIEAVLDRVRTWPIDRQVDAARILLRMEEIDAGEIELSDEDMAALDEAEAEIERGEVASDEEVRALLEQYRQ